MSKLQVFRSLLESRIEAFYVTATRNDVSRFVKRCQCLENSVAGLFPRFGETHAHHSRKKIAEIGAKNKNKPLEHPDLVTVAIRVPKGVICLVSALLSTR
ncbi:hypothetical protein OO006_09620 [Prosthecochloris sp. SCSIO W1101]|uniref:hypothetical protein n=1 Tax=Prosthecochloris sp. SCSIO W1101 TaxID=2992242 RepID=UPI00223D974D|nr:hypothetical protein [Prosthecochloris sp. SCSIO W1101]UZJ40612.1 hypothetical protein OO006_09620 [Prosthecochloris sp. SCSIO W1101]